MMEVEFSTVDSHSLAMKDGLCENVSSKDDDPMSGASDGDLEPKQSGDATNLGAQEGSESDNQPDGQKKKRRRRGKNKGGRHHRKWKPYNKLTWTERKELEERETNRATRKREEAFASGHPVAPYNTTQFLIDDHIQSEASPDLLHVAEDVNNGKARDGSFGSGDSSEAEYCDSPDEDDMFLAKEFSETYDNIHAERLQTMSKDDLIKDYLEMERKVETLEKKIKDADQHKTRDGSTGDRDSSDGHSLSSGGEEPVDINGVKKIEQQIQHLRTENNKLRDEIGKLKTVK